MGDDGIASNKKLGRMHAVVDAVTGLPWSSSRSIAAEELLAQRTHLLQLQLGGLDRLTSSFGKPVANVAFRHVARRLARLLDTRDELSRHGEVGFLLMTTRPVEELSDLSEAIHREVDAAAIEVEGERHPRVHISMTSAGPFEAAAQARAAFDALSIAPVLIEPGIASATAVDTPGPASSPADARILPPQPADGEGVARPPVLEQASGVAARDEQAGLDPTACEATVHRIMLREIRVTVVEGKMSVTSVVASGDNQVSSTIEGANEEHRFAFVGEATANAVTKLLPPGYGVVVYQISDLGPGGPAGIFVTVGLRSPQEDVSFLGIAPIRENLYWSVARAILNAINRRIEAIPCHT